MLKGIIQLLKKQPGLKARDIARELGVERKPVSVLLHKSLDIFVQDPSDYGWSLIKDASFELELTSSGTWVTQLHFEKALLKYGSPLEVDHGHVIIRITDERRLLLCAAARVLALANQLVAAGKKVEIDFTNNESTVSYLSRACFFARLDSAVKVLPKRPASSAAEQYMANNLSLVELLEICDEVNVPERIKYSFEKAFGDKDATKLFTLVAELVGNVEEHSDTIIPGFAGLQSYGRDPKHHVVVVVISDSGKGICATLRPGLQEHFPKVAKKFDSSIHAADPKLILHAMLNRGLSRLGKGRGAGFHTSQEEAAKLDAKVTVRQESFSIFMQYKKGVLEVSSWKLDLPKLIGTHIVFEFSLTKK